MKAYKRDKNMPLLIILHFQN